ncbi:MAG: hypothetical protein ACRDZ4_08740 [Egibacteraceae bacterium]
MTRSNLILCLALGALALGGRGRPNRPAGQVPTATVTETAAPAPSSQPASEPPKAQLKNGRHFGFVKRVDAKAPSLTFDLAYFLTGAEADKAAQEHGVIGPSEHIDFIVNDNPRLRTLPVHRGAGIRVLKGGSVTLKGAMLESLASSLPQSNGFWVKVEGGKVIDLEEQPCPGDSATSARTCKGVEASSDTATGAVPTLTDPLHTT